MEFAYKTVQWVPCYRPLRGFFGKTVDPRTGRRPLVFNINQSFSGVPVDIPCGQCIGCRLEKSRQWTLRIVHEQKLHADSAFLTLSYDDKNLPAGGTLVKRDLQLFMKRLRKKRPNGIRFFACGEYGEKTFRPHYHVLLLNTWFADRKKWSMSGDNPLYRSKELEELWSVGDSWIGDVTPRSAAYVARYCVKKLNGPLEEAFLKGRAPEFIVMSRKPGIGKAWFDKYYGEAYKADSAIADAREVKLPRYYDGKYEMVDSERLAKIKKVRRRKAAMVPKSEKLVDRRRVRERFTELKLAHFKRDVL